MFLEQLARHLRENPGGQTSFPPALHGLLASRLDLLPEDERTLLERGAVEGDLFHLESVAAGPGGGSAAISGSSLDRALDALIRRDLVAPVAGGGLGGRSAVGFRHRLIRGAAYAMHMTGAAMALFDARMRLRAGDHRGAEEAIQDALRTGRRCGDRWVESTALADLAHVVVAAGRRQDAARAVAEIDNLPAPRDTEWLVRRLTARSLLASLSANHEAAVRQASDAAARVDGTQFLPLRSHVHWTRALALHHAGHRDQAVRAQETARALALAKGDLAFATSLDPFPPLG